MHLSLYLYVKFFFVYIKYKKTVGVPTVVVPGHERGTVSVMDVDSILTRGYEMLNMFNLFALVTRQSAYRAMCGIQHETI